MSGKIHCLNDQFTPRDDVAILFQGNKPLIRPRINLDLIIAHHFEQDYIEIIAYHPILGKEAPRLYYSVQMLLSNIDQNEISNLVEMQKESSLRRRKSINMAKFTDKVILESIKKFVFYRIDVIYDHQESFSINLRKLSRDVELSGSTSNKFSIDSSKPDDVTPLETNFFGRVRESKEVERFLKELKYQAEELKKATKVAELIANSTEGFRIALDEKLKLKDCANRQTLAVLRWKRAIRKTMFKILLEKVKIRLLSFSPKVVSPRSVGGLETDCLSLNKAVSDSAFENKNIRKPLKLPAITKANSLSKAKSFRSSNSNSLTALPSTSNHNTPRVSHHISSSNSNLTRNSSSNSFRKQKSKSDLNSELQEKSFRKSKKISKANDEDKALISANKIIKSTHQLLDSLLDMTRHLVYPSKNKL